MNLKTPDTPEALKNMKMKPDFDTTSKTPEQGINKKIAEAISQYEFVPKYTREASTNITKLHEFQRSAYEAITNNTNHLEAVEMRLGNIETHLGNVEERLGDVETHLKGVETHLNGVEERLGDVEERLGNVEKKLDCIEERLEAMQQESESKFSQIIQMLQSREKTLYIKSNDVLEVTGGMLKKMHYPSEIEVYSRELAQ